MRAELRARTAPEIIDAGVQLARQHYVPLLVISVVALLPAGVIEYVNHQVTWGGQWLTFASIPFVMVADAALVVGARDAYEGGTPMPSRALGLAIRRLWAVAISGLVRSTLVAIGLVVLVAPGLMMLGSFALVPGIAVLEPIGGAERALKRSGELTEGLRRHALAAYGLPSLFLLAATATFQLLYARAGGPRILVDTGPILASMAVRPFTSAIQTVLYFDLRIRKEAYDIETMLADDAPAAA